MEIIIILLLLSLSALFSGLTLGLLSLSKTELERKMAIGDERALKVYPVRKKGNLLLCTLLLGNVAVNSSLSIYLGNMVSGLIAGTIATGLIVVFGEILPQAACSRYALQVGSRTVWLVRLFIFILYPVAAPLTWLLDKLLGEELPMIWSRAELAEIIKLHEDSPHSSVDADEERIILGALTFSAKTAKRIMTPRSMVFALDVKDILDDKRLKEIKDKGYTRIPVFKETPDSMAGILYAKDLIGVAPGVKVENIFRKNNLLIISEDKKLDEILNEFVNRKTHISFVINEYGDFEGIVTMEDVIEEVLKVEIVDESDICIDTQSKAREKAKNLLKNI